MKLGFFQKLYSSSDIVEKKGLQSLFNNQDSRVLSNLVWDSIEGLLSHQEILNALKKAKMGSLSGPIVLPLSFSKSFFWPVLYLLSSLNFGCETWKLSVTQQYGIITLLPKEEKPHQFLKNWRPISLLNITYVQCINWLLFLGNRRLSSFFYQYIGIKILYLSK